MTLKKVGSISYIAGGGPAIMIVRGDPAYIAEELVKRTLQGWHMTSIKKVVDNFVEFEATLKRDSDFETVAAVDYIVPGSLTHHDPGCTCELCREKP
jgi:hypothetical protein